MCTEHTNTTHCCNLAYSNFDLKQQLDAPLYVNTCVCACTCIQILVLEAASWMFVPEVMHQRAWTAPMRLELVFQRHPAAAPWARAGEIHVNHALLSTQVSHPIITNTLLRYAHIFYVSV